MGGLSEGNAQAESVEQKNNRTVQLGFKKTKEIPQRMGKRNLSKTSRFDFSEAMAGGMATPKSGNAQPTIQL